MSEWGDGDRRGVNIDLDADALGHDLRWGTATFTRTIRSASVETEDANEAVEESEESEAEENSGVNTSGQLDTAIPF
jgi:single-strand DNA-binding protein